jgi:hypothetical protein
MAEKTPPAHIRLPQRSDAVAGQEQRPGMAASAAVPDPRTASQDPALTIKMKSV